MIPGIFTPLEDARTWDLQAQAWCHARGDAACGLNVCDGLVGATLALWDQARMAAGDLTTLGQYFAVRLVGHSNGARIAAEAVAAFNTEVEELHLIAAAMAADCQENGLNGIARRGLVKKIVLYVSPEDDVLGLPGSYGRLGKLGPVEGTVCEELGKMMTVQSRPYKHSEWVGEKFQETMATVAGETPALQETA